MKKIILSVAFSLVSMFSILASAQTLQDVMKTIALEYRAIALSVQMAEKNAENAVHAANLKAAFIAGKAILPNGIAALPAADQASARLRFEALMQTGVNLSDELVTALTANRQQDAITISQKLGDLKREGHLEFR